MTSILRWLNEPKETKVGSDSNGRPASVEGACVVTVKEEWLVEEGWWTRTPVRRHYFELILETGDAVVVFQDLEGRGWFTQRA